MVFRFEIAVNKKTKKNVNNTARLSDGFLSVNESVRGQ